MPELSVPIRCRGALVKIVVRPGQEPVPGAQPAPVGPLPAYLDTGASDTMLDLGVLRSLPLSPRQQAALNVLGRADVSFHEQYDVEVALVVPGEGPRWLPLTVLGGAVYQTGAVAALGRDFLAHVVLAYDGPARRARLRW